MSAIGRFIEEHPYGGNMTTTSTSPQTNTAMAAYTMLSRGGADLVPFALGATALIAILYVGKKMAGR